MAKAKVEANPNEALLKTLQQRFELHKSRHAAWTWKQVAEQLAKNTKALPAILALEQSGGEPDAVDLDGNGKQIYFVDCAAESPAGRRSFCYDQKALDARKEHKPKNSAMNAAAQMGVELLNEAQYRKLQEYGAFDLKTSSWILTPDAIRKLGGAIFCDRRYNTVFTYHNGAESYYAARGFRAFVKI